MRGFQLKNILITGKPGCGKTTIVRKIVEELHLNAGGFYTEEIRIGGQRRGFTIKTFDGEQAILAHVDIESPYKVSKYGVDVKSFEKIGVKSIWKAIEMNDVVVIDEIGKMELFSSRFREAVRVAIESEKILLATILLASHPYTDKIKRRNDVKIFYLARENRDRIKEEIKRKIREIMNV